MLSVKSNSFIEVEIFGITTNDSRQVQWCSESTTISWEVKNWRIVIVNLKRKKGLIVDENQIPQLQRHEQKRNITSNEYHNREIITVALTRTGCFDDSNVDVLKCKRAEEESWSISPLSWTKRTAGLAAISASITASRNVLCELVVSNTWHRCSFVVSNFARGKQHHGTDSVSGGPRWVSRGIR